MADRLDVVGEAKMVNWRSKGWLKLAGLVLLAHALFLFVFVPLVSSRLKHSYNQNQFADGYNFLAANLVAGHGYRFYPDTAQTMMREPGYPVFLAGLMFIAGSSIKVVKIANFLIALASAWVAICLAKKVAPSLKTSQAVLVAAPPVLVLLSPGMLIAESRGGVEVLFGLLIAIFLLTVYRAIASNQTRDYVISGGVLGMTVLVRSTPMLFPVFLMAYLLMFERQRTSGLAICRNIIAMFVTMLVCLSPWIVRNYQLTGKVVPTGSVLGVSAQAGQYINTHLFEGRPWWLLDREASRKRDQIAFHLGYKFEDGLQGYYQTFYSPTDELKFSSYLDHEVMEEYRKSPLLFARCVGQNLFNFWFAGKTWLATGMNLIAQLPFLVLMGIGLGFCLRTGQMRAIGPLILFVAYYWAVHLPILAQARYSIPLMPLLSVIGAIGLAAIYERVANARKVTTSNTARSVA